MFLKVHTPFKILIKEKVAKILVEGSDGFFGILPKHIDTTTKLVPSILTYEDAQGEGYMVVDEGILVKKGDGVQICTKDVWESRDLGKIHEVMRQKQTQMQEEEEQSALETTKLELGIVKRFYDLGKGKS